MNKATWKICVICLCLGAAAALSACSYPNAAAPGPSAIAYDNTGTQLWLISSGKLYRCSGTGNNLGCQEVTTNVR